MELEEPGSKFSSSTVASRATKKSLLQGRYFLKGQNNWGEGCRAKPLQLVYSFTGNKLMVECSVTAHKKQDDFRLCSGLFACEKRTLFCVHFFSSHQSVSPHLHPNRNVQNELFRARRHGDGLSFGSFRLASTQTQRCQRLQLLTFETTSQTGSV